MELAQQTQLIRELMISIAPEISRHTLSSIEYQIEAEVRSARRAGSEFPSEEHLAMTRNYAASDNAQMCLRWSMHLAGAYATFLDEANRSTTPDPIKEKLAAAQSLQHEAAPRSSGV